MSEMTGMDMAMSEAVDPRWENEKNILKWAKEQLGVTEEDMRDTSIVSAKIRNAKIEKVIQD